MYLTYAEYQQFGGNLDEPEFMRAEFAARVDIDFATRGRLRNETPVRETVKMLVLELIMRGLCGELDGVRVSSMNNGMVSESYESKDGLAAEFIKKALANEDLEGVPLIPAGLQFAPVRRC